MIPSDWSKFLCALFKPEDVVLVRLIETWTEGGKKKSRTVGTYHYPAARLTGEPELVGAFLAEAAKKKANTFFGVCPRSQASPDFDKACQIPVVRFLWSDLDDCDPATLTKRCADNDVPHPSIVVRSGHGCHAYWLLAEPVPVPDHYPEPIFSEKTDDGRKLLYVKEAGKKRYVDAAAMLSPVAQRLQDIIAGVAQRIGGDATQDVSRLLRLPGTMNRKNERNGDTPTPCEIEQFTGTVYRLRDFERFALVREVRDTTRPAVSADVATDGSAIETLIARYNLQDRSDSDWRIVKEAIKAGWTPDQLWDRVQDLGKFAERGWDYLEYTWDRAMGDFENPKVKPDVVAFFNEIHGKPEVTPTIKARRKLVYSGREFWDLADQDVIDWIIADRLENGGLYLFSGKPYCGKSVVVAHLIGCLIEGLPFFGTPTRKTHVLYIDTDRNRISRMRTRISRVATREAVFSHFAFANVDELGDALTEDAIASCIEAAAAQFTGKVERLLVVIDTFRSAFLTGLEMGGESDSVSMMKVLKPIKRLSRKTGATFMILHHDPKYSGEIAGSGAIPGVTDGVWGYGAADPARKLTVRTRDDVDVPPISLTYSPTDGLRVYDPESDMESRKLLEEAEAATRREICGQFPTTAAAALTLDAIGKLPHFTKPDGKPVARSTIQYKIALCEKPGVYPRLDRIGEGKKNDPHMLFSV